MSTIRKTISISKKDKKLQNLIKDVPSYEVSHVIRQLMYDGLKYRALVESRQIKDEIAYISPKKVEKIDEKVEKIEKNSEKSLKIDDFEQEIDLNDVKLEKIEEEDEDLEDLLLNNS